ncbi:MAG: cob(I)yrinic acid a,c-diamide adenosyltransferase [Thermoguttaceae bacterium]
MKPGDRDLTDSCYRSKVSKSSRIIEALGELDELNAVIGLARTEELDDEIDTILDRIQWELFEYCGALLKVQMPIIPDGIFDDFMEKTTKFEIEIDGFQKRLTPINSFVLPGGNRKVALLHVARTVCRRAERRVVKLVPVVKVTEPLLAYINRLSELLFVISRHLDD